MSSHGAARFSAISRLPYSYMREPASETESRATSPLRDPPKSKLGSMASKSQCRSSSGTPSRMQIICMGNSAATSTTKSKGTPGSIWSSRSWERMRRSSCTRRIIRGVNPELTNRRIRACRGSSIMFSTCPAIGRSCRSVPPKGRSPPVTEENVSGSRRTARVSAWVATDQKPSPSGVCSVGPCQNTGAARRWISNKRWGNPSAKLSRSVKSISANSLSDIVLQNLSRCVPGGLRVGFCDCIDLGNHPIHLACRGTGE